MATVLLGAFSSYRKLEGSLRRLQYTLSLNLDIRIAHEAAALAFWELYDSQPGSTMADYKQKIRDETEALQRYEDFPLNEEEQAEVDHLRAVEKKFRTLTDEDLNSWNPADGNLLERKREVARQSSEIKASLGQLSSLEIRELDGVNARLEKFSRWSAVALIVLAIFGFAVVAWFRDAHRRYLWGPLDQLRSLAGEMRRGNLNATMDIPQNIELGSLVSGFLEMERELAAMRDSLEQKVAERTARLEETQSELLQSAKLASLGQLVSGVAHEINNPLTSILGFSEVLLNRPGTDPALCRPLRMIREEALRVRHLVSNLTSFARRAPSRMQRIDLRILLAHIADLRRYQLLASNIYLHLQPPKEPLWVLADPDQLMQVLLNLVLNSEQAIPDGRRRGDIWISSGKDKGVAWLSVKDTGLGIDAAIRDRIFDPFFTTRPAGQGTGLGLSIVHGIVQQHRGSIEVDSKPGEGSTFLIRLPLAPEQTENPSVLEGTESKRPQVLLFDPSVELETPEAAGEISPVPVPAPLPMKSESSPKYQVLVIDDERGILEMVSDALERLQCRSTLLTGSADAPAAIEHGHFNLILCDLKMPGQSGLDILRFTREKRPDLALRFLLMTGNLADTEKHAVELAGVPVLSKPFTLSRLRETVEEFLPKKAPA
ncbi:MAG TPA: ATP-binding protein [Candidatus Limnocylindrales bacterium]|nr:ATP-binding protein [Candidatus Limnocylindrales bacterium]